MSRAKSTNILPIITYKSATSEADAPFQNERFNLKFKLSELEDTTEKETSDDTVLWVDWDGPGDPKNPEKWVVRLIFV